MPIRTLQFLLTQQPQLRQDQSRLQQALENTRRTRDYYVRLAADQAPGSQSEQQVLPRISAADRRIGGISRQLQRCTEQLQQLAVLTDGRR